MTGGELLAAATGALQGSGGSGGLDDFGEMTPRTHAFVLGAAVFCIVFILRLVRRHGLRSKYALLWLSLAVLLAVLGVFPGLLVWVSRLVGIHYPPATFLAFGIVFLFLVVIQFSWELSRLEERTRILSESAALLAAEVDRLRSAQSNGVLDAAASPTDAVGTTELEDSGTT